MDKTKLLAHPNYRYLSTIFDGSLIFLLNLPVMILSDFFERYIILIFLYRVLVYLIFDLLIPICTKGQTVGRSLLKLRVVNDDFTYVKPVRLLIRSSIFVVLAFLAIILNLGLVTYIIWMIIFMVSIYLLYKHPLRKTVHDHLAKTVVVKDEEFKKAL